MEELGELRALKNGVRTAGLVTKRSKSNSGSRPPASKRKMGTAKSKSRREARVVVDVRMRIKGKMNPQMTGNTYLTWDNRGTGDELVEKHQQGRAQKNKGHQC